MLARECVHTRYVLSLGVSDARQLPPQYFGTKSLNSNTLQQLTRVRDAINVGVGIKFLTSAARSWRSEDAVPAGEASPKNINVFSVLEPEGMRTYIYDKKEKYIIVLQPSRYIERLEYYLLTAYPLRGGDARKIENKQKRKENTIY